MTARISRGDATRRSRPPTSFRIASAAIRHTRLVRLLRCTGHAKDALAMRFVRPPSRPGEFHPEPLTGRVEDWRFRSKFVFPVVSPFRLRVSHHLDRATFPAPATSNAACGFPALRSPVCFTSRVMGPIVQGRHSASTTEPCSRCTAAVIRTAIAYSIASSRGRSGSGPAPYGA
jgi:hypothetical protein